MPRPRISESEKKWRKKLRDQARLGRSVYLGDQIKRWFKLKEFYGVSHSALARILMDSYERWGEKVEPESSQEPDLKPIAGWNIPMEKEHDLTRDPLPKSSSKQNKERDLPFQSLAGPYDRKQSSELQNFGKLAVKFSDISSKLTTLRKDTKSADMFFVIKDGTEVTAHKTIVSRFSKVLRQKKAMKYVGPLLSDATQCGLDGFLDLVYGLEVSLTTENFNDILHVAEVLKADKVTTTLKSVQHRIAAPKTRAKEENIGFNVKQEIVNEQMDDYALETTEQMYDNGVIQHETMDVINQENDAASEGYGACETSPLETEGKFDLGNLKNEKSRNKDDTQTVTIERYEEKSPNESRDESMENQEYEADSTDVNTKAMDGDNCEDIKPNSYDTSNKGDISKGHEIKTELRDSSDSAEEYDDEHNDEYDEYNIEEDDSDSDIPSDDSGSNYSIQDDEKDLDWTPAYKLTPSSTQTRNRKKTKSDIDQKNDETSPADQSDSNSDTRKTDDAKKTKTPTNGNESQSRSRPHITWREKYIDQAIGEFKCPNCQNILETKFKLREHVEAKHDQFMCPLCDQCFNTNGERDLHRQAHYRFENSDSSVGEFFCDICDVKFTSKHIFLLHMLQQGHINKRGSTKLCIQCETWIPNTDFKKHLSSKHDFSVTQCSICKEKLSSRGKDAHKLNNSATEMQKHLHLKHKIRSYNCVFCDQTSSTLYFLKNHIVNTHHRWEIQRCLHCSFTCGTVNKMRAHVRETHKLRTSYVCKKCGDTFETYKMRISHIRRKHSTLNPCEYCGKKLDRKNMAQHVRVHTGHKPYICEHCGEKFAQKNSLNWHMSSKHSHLDEEKNTSKKLKSTGKRKKRKS